MNGKINYNLDFFFIDYCIRRCKIIEGYHSGKVSRQLLKFENIKKSLILISHDDKNFLYVQYFFYNGNRQSPTFYLATQ